MRVRAVIDVGTNSVKLLVGEVDATGVRPLHESSHQTRLGQGFYQTQLLQPGAIRETAKTVAEFATQAATLGAKSVAVIATSAARDARNKEELLHAIHRSCGLEVIIISGEREADWAYRGVRSDRKFAGKALLVVDVGGGSTELIAGRGAERLFGESFQVGSVRLLEGASISDPPSVADRDRVQGEISSVLELQVEPRLRSILNDFDEIQLVGTGGTSTILARIKLGQEHFDRDQIETTQLSVEEVRAQSDRLWSLPLAERRNIVGLPPNRADVILTGALIFERLMAFFQFRALNVSTRGIRFAALMEL